MCREQDSDWATDSMLLTEDELSFALGQQGATRKQIEEASECILAYVGRMAIFNGTNEQRDQAKERAHQLLRKRGREK